MLTHGLVVKRSQGSNFRNRKHLRTVKNLFTKITTMRQAAKPIF